MYWHLLCLSPNAPILTYGKHTDGRIATLLNGPLFAVWDSRDHLWCRLGGRQSGPLSVWLIQVDEGTLLYR